MNQQALVSIKKLLAFFLIIVLYHNESHNKTEQHLSAIPRTTKIENIKGKKTPEKKAEQPPRKKKRRQRKKKTIKKDEKIEQRKTLSNMKFEELKKNKDECLAKNDKKIALKYLEKMVPLCNDLEELSGIMIELANLFFDLEQFNKATTMYQEFAKLYPGSKNVEYALYKAIEANYKMISGPERDQTKTYEIIELANRFLVRPSFTHYKKEVTTILVKSRERLLENEIGITNFYLKQGKTKSAKKRLDGIRKDHLEHLPSPYEAPILQLEYQLAKKENNEEEALQKIALLKEKFPDHATITVAHNKKQPFANRF